MASPTILQRSPLLLTRQLGRCYLSSSTAYKSRSLLRNPATINITTTNTVTQTNPTTSAASLEVPHKTFHPRHSHSGRIYPISTSTSTSSTVHRQTARPLHTMAANKEFALLCLENPLLGEFTNFFIFLILPRAHWVPILKSKGY